VKGLMGIVVIGALAFIAYTMFGDALLGGQSADTGGLTDRLPDELPDANVNDRANQAEDAANTAADEVSSWTPATWKIIVLAISATVATVLWFRSPKFKYIVIGAFAVLLAVVAFA
jgi:hypothetical protein